ncbi:5585_t:CDS:2, partial [Scutellospora calospora]
REGNRDIAKLEHGRSTGYEGKVRVYLDSKDMAKLEHRRSTGHEPPLTHTSILDTISNDIETILAGKTRKNTKAKESVLNLYDYVI